MSFGLYISSFALLFSLFVLTPATIYAQKAPTNSSASAQQTEKLKTKANNEIDRRINSLNSVSGRINSSTKLTVQNKQALGKLVKDEITSLTALKTKIEGDTTLAALRVDVKTIVTDYRVYALILPKIALINAADTVIESTSKASASLNEIKDQIPADQQATFDDLQSRITDASIQANNAEKLVMSLDAKDYPGNKSTLQTARTYLQTARLDLGAAKKDKEQILQAMRSK